MCSIFYNLIIIFYQVQSTWTYTWNIDIEGVDNAAVSTNWTCPKLDKTTILEDIDGKLKIFRKSNTTTKYAFYIGQ